MKIKSIKINNFRSIKEVDITGPIDDVWTFVGQNNAGKSSAMHAIRAFYGEYDVKAEDFCRSDGANKPIEIVMEYKLSDEEFSQLPEQYKLSDNNLIVVKRYTRDSLKGESHGFTKNQKTGDVVEVEEEFFGAKNVDVGKLGTVIYIPAVKDLGEELKKTKSSLFSKLISRILTETLTDLPSWNNLIKNTEEFANDLKSTVKSTGDFKSVNEIEENLSARLSGWGLKSQITISAPSPEDIILSGAKLRFISNETGIEEDSMNLGSGAQRSIVNNLLLLWAEIESKKVKTDKKKFSGEITLLLYEEPEALLHYDQECKLLRNLEALSKTDNSQVIICTHSPNLISAKNESLKCVSRFVKSSGVSTKYSATEKFLDDLKTNAPDFDFVLWLNPDRNTMFFVDKVILVEGPSDKAFLNYLTKENNLDKNSYIVDCGNKSNIPNFMRLCEQFGINHSVMYDKDGDTTANHKAWNKAVVDAKNSFTIDIKEFPMDLETYINFDKVSSSDKYKKPLEVLRQLKEEKLSGAHNTEFITFLNN